MIAHRVFRSFFAAALLLSAFTSAAVSAAIINFSGQIDVLTDLGGARYSGVTLGQVMSGSFNYGTASQATTDPGFPGDYDFSIPPFGGTISDGGTPTSGSSGEIVQVSVVDDAVLDQATADLINTLIGTSLTNGSVADIADIDTIFTKPGNTGEIVFGLSFINDNSAWSGTAFGNFPPESGNIGPAIFFLSETDAAGNVIFDAFGEIDNINVIPLPAAVWLFPAGLLLLTAVARRGRSDTAADSS